MSRSIRDCPGRPEDANPYPDAITKSYEIQVITPLFGGGAKAGENDEVTLIRPSSIRGHLRFWWRATRGARFEAVEELRQREGEVWGTTENPSPVSIEIAVEERDEPSECAHYKWNPKKRRGEGGYDLRWSHPFNRRGNPLTYVLFPFQGTPPDSENPKLPTKIVRSVRFRLTVRIPKQELIRRYIPVYNKQREEKGLTQLVDEDHNIEIDVEAALWAWVNFGGIGARTRRGCGALHCLEANPLDPDLIPPSLQEFKDWLKDRLTYFGLPLSSESGDKKWPTFGKIYMKDGRDLISCWENSISIMKDFRQGVEVGRNLGSDRRPGRSRWPEPESLRELVLRQQNLPSRPHRWHPPDHRIKDLAFPRVEFGMPIIIEIRGENIKPTLQHDKDHDRMASPLILRPITFSNGRFASMILRLNTPILESAYVKPGKRDLVSGCMITASQIRDPLNAEYEDSPMSGLCDTGSALDAFIAFAIAEERGFQEVGL